ncbi:hypothetical protein Psta_2995 [Pirellula staleyi DSM 6068]|uniref:Uncharacterized protein n=1 Tax=Pirellula staleyi (strain ATCC 27377 / DSM 6068 / ICPB 4128) TaxID=530564 RepID=D2R9B0_PIRSD|nr:hypothetical protein [Pirellula staleyi]ADB17660.1 hypothetical protein Psta_2995 [Pirellula staleyi DSM 6068]
MDGYIEVESSKRLDRVMEVPLHEISNIQLRLATGREIGQAID